MDVIFQRRDGSVERVSFPDKCAPDADAQINAIADTIRDECFARDWSAKAKRVSVGKTARAAPEVVRWLMPVAYQLISQCLDLDLEYIIYRRSVARGGYARGWTGTANPFQLGLSGIFSKTPNFLGDDQRQRTGQSLWYAYRHYVPWQFVSGFDRQVGKLDQKRADEAIEAGFEDWIVERRILDLSPVRNRQGYPPYIDQRVKMLRSEALATFSRLGEALTHANEFQVSSRSETDT